MKKTSVSRFSKAKKNKTRGTIETWPKSIYRPGRFRMRQRRSLKRWSRSGVQEPLVVPHPFATLVWRKSLVIAVRPRKPSRKSAVCSSRRSWMRCLNCWMRPQKRFRAGDSLMVWQKYLERVSRPFSIVRENGVKIRAGRTAPL
jgi:hypothetical protein